MKAGAAVEEVNTRMQTPLHAAAGYSWQANALELLKAGPTVNRQDADGRTPLHQAVSGDLRQTVKGLLALGADPSIRDAKGKSPLDLAQETRMTPLVELLKRAVKLPNEHRAAWSPSSRTRSDGTSGQIDGPNLL